MDNRRKEEILNNMIRIKGSIENGSPKSEDRIQTIRHYKDFKFSGTNLGKEDVYIAEITKYSDKIKDRGNDTQKEKTILQIYDKDSNLIATIDEMGLIYFEDSYLKELEKISTSYYKQLNLEDFDLDLSQEEDLLLTDKQIEEEKLKREVSELAMTEDTKKDKMRGNENKVNQKQHLYKQEINPNVRITQTETLADMIPEIKEKGYEKIIVDYSNSNKGETGRFSFRGIDKDGNEGPIKSLKNTEGTTTGQKVTSINSRDGSIVEEEQVAGLVKINGRNAGRGMEELLSIKTGPYGILEVDYVRAELSRDKETRYISAPIETKDTKPTTREVKDFMDKSKNADMNKELDRAQPEIERDEKSELQNIDDTASNDQLTADDIIVLKDGTETTLRKEAIKDRVLVDDFVKRYNERTDKTPDEKINNIHDEYEEEYRGNLENRRR